MIILVIGSHNGEEGPWNIGTAKWREGYGTDNWVHTLFLIKTTFQALIDMSTELNMDADPRERWKHFHDNIHVVPPRVTERRSDGRLERRRVIGHAVALGTAVAPDVDNGS